MRSLVILYFAVCALPAVADAPNGYQCAPGKPNVGVGCTCPKEYVSRRDGESNAICGRLPNPTPTQPTKLTKTTLVISPDPRGDDLAGARVSLDGKPAGTLGAGPLTIDVPPNGRYLVEVFKEGFPTFSTIVWSEKKQTPITVPFPKHAPLAACPTGMVRVPAGSFGMGSDQSGYEIEQPRHTVTLSTYCIDRTEVTAKAYEACVTAKVCRSAMPGPKTNKQNHPEMCNAGRSDRQDHPINCVDWNQSSAFCAWAGKRLPTEAEWEYAALGSDGRTYSWGDSAPTPRRMNGCGIECREMWKRLTNNGNSRTIYDVTDSWEFTAPVGSFPDGISPFGALDMSGNVEEWIGDARGKYPTGPVQDPKGGGDLGWTLRGGSFASSSRVDGTYRGGNQPDTFNFPWQGFRCAKGG